MVHKPGTADHWRWGAMSCMPSLFGVGCSFDVSCVMDMVGNAARFAANKF